VGGSAAWRIQEADGFRDECDWLCEPMNSLAQRRAAARTEQAKVVSGSGWRASFDRGAWAVGGGRRAGEFRLLRGLVGLVCVGAGMYAVGSDPAAIAGGVSGYSLLLSRGHWLNRRYLQRTGTR
jgi:hypothetical protein